MVPCPKACDIGCHPLSPTNRRKVVCLKNPIFRIFRNEEEDSISWIPDDPKNTPCSIPIPFMQGPVGTCWAIVVAMALQCFCVIHGDPCIPGFQIPCRTPRIYRRSSLMLSPQSLVDCYPCSDTELSKQDASKWSGRKSIVKANWDSDGSYTASTESGLEYASVYGLPLLATYPYTGPYKKCHQFQPVIAPTGYRTFNPTGQYDPLEYDIRQDATPIEEIIQSIEISHILGTMTTYDNFVNFEGGKDNIYFAIPKGKENPVPHAVLIIGTGIYNGRRFFEILNTYASWGVFGVGRIDHSCFISMECITGIGKFVNPRNRN